MTVLTSHASTDANKSSIPLHKSPHEQTREASERMFDKHKTFLYSTVNINRLTIFIIILLTEKEQIPVVAKITVFPIGPIFHLQILMELIIC